LHSTIRNAKVEKENCVRTEVLRPEGPKFESRRVENGVCGCWGGATIPLPPARRSDGAL